MGGLFSKKHTEPAKAPAATNATHPTTHTDLHVGHGQSATLHGTENKHIKNVEAKNGGTLNFGLQNLYSMNL